MTALWCKDPNAIEIVQGLRDICDVEATPNGGNLAHHVFRISHMGDQSDADITELIDGLTAVINGISQPQNVLV